MASEYVRITKERSFAEANLALLRLQDRLQIGDLNLTKDWGDLRVFASEKAAHIRRLAAQNDLAHALAEGSNLAESCGIRSPVPEAYGGHLLPCINRLACDKWWFSQIKKIQIRVIEEVSRDLRLVQKARETYVSDSGLRTNEFKKAANEVYLETTYITNDTGDRFSLKDIASRSVSNPAIRRAELMTRIKGFEMVAADLGHAAEFYTVTVPSRMHAQHRDGRRNAKYDGTTPLQAHAYLNQLWQCVRAKLSREDIQIYGFRVVEPHHDGTPHWHLLLFMQHDHQKKVRKILRHYSLLEDGNERGAKKSRFKHVAIDPALGSAAGYIAKYIAKNVDGAHIEKDLHGKPAAASALRIEAWARTYGIRQFQQVGGPSVIVWRELRRLQADQATDVAGAYAAADSGNWAAYVMMMGGPQMRRSECPLRPFYYREPEALPTGELNPDAITVYGDRKSPSTRGIVAPSGVVITRLREWRIEKIQPS
jgi:hypothetical protein